MKITVKYFNPKYVYKAFTKKILSDLPIKWIPFSKLENLEEIGQGGFGIIYKANYLGEISKFRNNSSNDESKVEVETVAIKRFLNSKNISQSFLNEVIIQYSISEM